ncbi:amidohydrolase [Pseudolabrys sp. FHR47]|uniref:amidohydrolase family protein n=1 Tax=Pseudolabrys sp. FHR47 TaxID=2562284 RepID=UPI00143DFF24|nr:amidohydrolase family protein [Pseudolabrys sp. FHR47]
MHVFGRPDEYGFAEDRLFMPSEARVQDVIAMHDAIGISRVVVVQASPQGHDNRCLVKALQDFESRGRQARGVAVVQAAAPADELAFLHHAGVRGLRVNLQSYGHTDPSFAKDSFIRTAEQAARMGWHIQTYAGLPLIAATHETIRTLPVPLVVDHYALAHASAGPEQSGFDVLLDLIRVGAIYVKLSAPYRIVHPGAESAGERIARPLIEANLSRMLWGTDWPHTGPWPGKARMRDRPEPFHPIDDGRQLKLFMSWVTPSEAQQILVGNPQDLYGFDDTKKKNRQE